MTQSLFQTALKLDVFFDTSKVRLGETVWKIEPSAIPHAILKQFARAYQDRSSRDVSLLLVEHDAEYRAVAYVSQLYPSALLEVSEVHMPQGEPREMMEYSQQL